MAMPFWGLHKMEANIKSDLSLQEHSRSFCFLFMRKGRESFWIAWKEFCVIRNPPKESLPLIPFHRWMLPSYRYVWDTLMSHYVRGVIENMLEDRHGVGVGLVASWTVGQR